ncbi:MAG: RDD family protein [Deltaproteobacteria bacterium]|nr:RDD family protein [Deltaproteobacteria bacterium]
MEKNGPSVSIETADHFELRFRIAGIGSRFLAFFIDRAIQVGALLGLFFLMLLILLAGSGSALFGERPVRFVRPSGQWVIALLIIAEGVVSIGYFLLFEYLWNGSTPGKRVVKIRVIRNDGRPISFIDSALRNVLRFVDVIAGIYPVGLVAMFIDSRNRRLGDLAAGTLGVEDMGGKAPEFMRSEPRAHQFDQLLKHAVADMSGEDYGLLSRFLDRRNEMDSERRRELAWEIYVRIFKEPGRRPATDGDLEKALEAIADLYRETTRIL